MGSRSSTLFQNQGEGRVKVQWKDHGNPRRGESSQEKEKGESNGGGDRLFPLRIHRIQPVARNYLHPTRRISTALCPSVLVGEGVSLALPVIESATLSCIRTLKLCCIWSLRSQWVSFQFITTFTENYQVIYLPIKSDKVHLICAVFTIWTTEKISL